MLGLRTQRDNDDKEFCRFFEVVQQAASEQGCVFFLDTAECRMGTIGDIDCEELSGWLVPNEKVDDFKKVWEAWGDVDGDFNDLFCFTEWSDNNGAVRIEFV